MAIASFNQARRSQCFGRAIAGGRIGAQPEYLPIGGIKLVFGSFGCVFWGTTLVTTKWFALDTQ
jgi:hypothetical protein